MKSLHFSSILLLFYGLIFSTIALDEKKESKAATDAGESIGKTEKLVTADSFNVGYYGHGHGHGHAPNGYANHYSYAKYVVPSPTYSVVYSYGYPNHHYSTGHQHHHGYTPGHHHLNYVTPHVTPAYIPIYTTAGHYPYHTGLSTSYNYGFSTHGRLAAQGLVSHGVPLYNSHRYHRFGVHH